MITAVARWLLTVVFAAAGLGAALPRRGPTDPADAAGRVPAVFCAAMCAALIAMTRWSEPAAVAWAQTPVFGCAALWVLARLGPAGTGRAQASWPARRYFIHERGHGQDPLPIVLTHSWPSSFTEHLGLIPLLASPPRTEAGPRTRSMS